MDIRAQEGIFFILVSQMDHTCLLYTSEHELTVINGKGYILNGLVPCLVGFAHIAYLYHPLTPA